MKHQRIQFALAHKETGDHAMRIHQDDSEDPIIGDSIADLIYWVAEWNDTDEVAACYELQSGDLSCYEIVAEEVTTRPLNPAEAAEFKQICHSDKWSPED